jgi:hypothetical protein
MTPLRRRILEDMQLRGLAPKTQQAYIGSLGLPVTEPLFNGRPLATD